MRQRGSAYNELRSIKLRAFNVHLPTATSLSYAVGSQKLDPHRIKTPDRIKIKFGAVD